MTMLIWELIPTKKKSDHWTASMYKGNIVVRAKDEEEARLQASIKFGIAAKIPPSKDTLFSPWELPDLVSCRCLKISNFDKKGPAEVLFPKP